MQRTRAWLRAAAVFAMGLVVAGPVMALGCLASQPLTRPGILQETSAQKAYVSTLRTSDETGNQIRVVVTDLRARDPGVENAELINYLMTAYCSGVAQLTGLGEQEMQARMGWFVSQLAQIIGQLSRKMPMRPRRTRGRDAGLCACSLGVDRGGRRPDRRHASQALRPRPDRQHRCGGSGAI
jgi:hypothetical protein